MKIFLLSSCRVHRPFNCDKDHKDGEFKNYDCLYSKWHETFFLGSLYCSNYILEVIKTLTYRENKQLINTGPPYFLIDLLIKHILYNFRIVFYVHLK